MCLGERGSTSNTYTLDSAHPRLAMSSRTYWLMVLLAGAICPLVTSSISGQESGSDAHHLLKRQGAGEKLPECRLDYRTSFWTDCRGILSQFHVSLDRSRANNPGIGLACERFVPGETYCIRRGKKVLNDDDEGDGDVYRPQANAGDDLVRSLFLC